MSIFAAKAAVKIQAAFRGHQVRSTMKKTETKTTTSAGAAGNAAASATTEHEPTKAELEAEFDPNDKGMLCSRSSRSFYPGYFPTDISFPLYSFKASKKIRFFFSCQAVFYVQNCF